MDTLSTLRRANHLVTNNLYADAMSLIDTVKSPLETKNLLNTYLYCCIKTGAFKRLQRFIALNASMKVTDQLTENHADLEYLRKFWFLYCQSTIEQILHVNLYRMHDDPEFFQTLEDQLCVSEQEAKRYILEAYEGYLYRNREEYRVISLCGITDFPYKYLCEHVKLPTVKVDPDQLDKISFIYCVKNRRKRTLVSVRSLVESIESYVNASTSKPIEIEIIIVEDVGQDEIEAFPTHGAYRFITHYLVDTGVGWTRSGLLNFGLKRSRGNLVAFCDADFLFPETFLGQFVATAGKLDFKSNVLAINCFETEVHSKDARIYSRWSPYGYMWVVDRDIATSIGGFDENYQGHGFEDRDFERRLVDQCALTVVGSHSIDDHLMILHLSHNARMSDGRDANRVRYLSGVHSNGKGNDRWGEQKLVARRDYGNVESLKGGAIEFSTIYSKLRRTYPDMPSRFETILQGLYTAILTPGDVAIDCGAHTGKHTIPLAKCVGARGKVYAFEANPLKADVLRKRIATEGVADTVDVFCSAVGEENKDDVSFFVVPENPGKSSLILRETMLANNTPSTEIHVPMVRLDDSIPTEQHVSFVKTDVEGAEINVLRGASRLIQTGRPVIHFECGGVAYRPFGIRSSDFFVFFDSIEYALFDIIGNHISCLDQWLASDSANGVYDYIAVPNHYHRLAEIGEMLRSSVDL